jgi:hypothetical protein
MTLKCDDFERESLDDTLTEETHLKTQLGHHLVKSKSMENIHDQQLRPTPTKPSKTSQKRVPINNQ